ncbi:MAG: hypothetical protein JWQ88_112 [Rhodoferax sp.]|nr:hypothetical protein [Rhodoferax sp.]
MDALSSLQAMGLVLPGPGYLIGTIVFGLVGMVAFRRGRRNAQRRTQWMGAALMFYPYAVDATWMLYLIGMALCASIWWEQRQ